MATYYIAHKDPELLYYFDGSDAAATDPDAAWTNETNADDGDRETVATTTTNGGSTSSYLMIEGTNAPASGVTINSVWVRLYYGPSTVNHGKLYVRTDGWSEDLYSSIVAFAATAYRYSRWSLLAVPTGGWTWAKIQALEVRVAGGSSVDAFDVTRIEVGVNLAETYANPVCHLVSVSADLNPSPGDTIYIAPGVYRERVLPQDSGTSGNQISWVGDVTGINTDGIGGAVRITGSDDDTVWDRDYCVSSSAGISYVTFRGISFDYTTIGAINIGTTCNNIIIEDCFFGAMPEDNDYAINLVATASDLITIRRCIFMSPGESIQITAGSEVSLDANSVIENCIFMPSQTSVGYGVYTTNIANLTIRNCTFFDRRVGVLASAALTGTIDVNNCVFTSCLTGLEAQATGDIIEDYNAISYCTTPRTNVDVGSNSNAYVFAYKPPMLYQGIEFPWDFISVHKSNSLALTGSGEASDDIFGSARPATAAKKTWGAIQYSPMSRETTTTRGSSTGSIKFDDAGRTQLVVPVTATSTTFSVYVYREANYAGTNPQMIIKDHGVADQVTTDAGSASGWNQLTDTYTPSGDSDFVVIELVSNNTATSGSFAVYFDDLVVS